ncbi:MAG: 16S rRNA (uracil(1498)-N(3))-methyltransferase [Desulfuromonadales bacterium]|nr:16S rRNA (uracil(1498)-N(3))-methyltransferase [Desulfuromonadales bacterium]
MNLVLLEDEDFIDDDHVRLGGRRFDHITTWLGKDSGDSLRVGRINGRLGRGVISAITCDSLTVEVHLEEDPPLPLPVTLLLALPRPKMLRRLLRGISSMGVKSLYLINSYRVDKNYWRSPLLHPEKIREQLCLGLEQGRDTVLPQVVLCPRFRPFVEDDLPAISAVTTNLVAHPGDGCIFPHQPQLPACLAVGPEGGFIPYEIDKLREANFIAAHLGKRILTVETAVPALLSRFIN